MIVRNDECVAWPAEEVLDFCPLDCESVCDMLIRRAKNIEAAPTRAVSEIVFDKEEVEYVVSLSWLESE